MFYLIEFTKILRKHVSASAFFVVSIVLVISAISKHEIDHYLKKNLAIEKPLPSFHVLMTGQVNVSSLTRKVTQLPGVKIVKVKENASINNQAKDLVEALKLDESFGINVGKYLGLQIFTKPNITEKSLNLIKEYIQRISGESRITFSKITNPDVVFGKTKEIAIQLIHRFGAIAIIGLLLSFWFLFLILSYSDISKRAYIIENFQRKKFAKFKILTTFVLLATLISLSSVFFIKEISFLGFMIVVTIMSVTCFASLNKTQWN